jgi:hypothetical protein
MSGQNTSMHRIAPDFRASLVALLPTLVRAAGTHGAGLEVESLAITDGEHKQLEDAGLLVEDAPGRYHLHPAVVAAVHLREQPAPTPICKETTPLTPRFDAVNKRLYYDDKLIKTWTRFAPEQMAILSRFEDAANKAAEDAGKEVGWPESISAEGSLRKLKDTKTHLNEGIEQGTIHFYLIGPSRIAWRAVKRRRSQAVSFAVGAIGATS